MVHSTESFFVYHFWSNWNLEKRGKPDNPEKTSRRKGENQQQM